MDPTKFDELTKSLATPTSRRQAVKTLAASAFGSILAFSGLDRVFARTGHCPPGLTLCHGKCVNTKTDPKNCGVCGTACVSGLCVNGLCCPPGAINCNNSCCDGTCLNGTTCCPTGQTCGTICCPVGQTCCGTTCCPAGQVCLNGNTCCPTNRVCGSICCPAGMICQGGMCVTPTCPDGNCTGCAPFFTPFCNSTVPCFCYQTTDSNCGCGLNVACAGAQHCGSCGDCPSGSFCAINTGCGAQGICIPGCTPGAKPGPLTGRTSAIR